MAKKAVESLQKGSKRFTKDIKMVKKNNSKNYSFVEKILPPDLVNEWFKSHE